MEASTNLCYLSWQIWKNKLWLTSGKHLLRVNQTHLVYFNSLTTETEGEHAGPIGTED